MIGLSWTGGAAFSPSGFSDADWPDVGNRPALSGSTLTWVGPLGGGANNGSAVQQTAHLTASGSLASTANNQVFKNLLITGNIAITHNNCSIIQCYLKAGSGGGFFTVNISGVGFLIEDSGFDGAGGTLFDGIVNSGPDGLRGGIIRRNNLLNFENHITGSPINCSITDNWLHSAQGTDADLVECYGGSTNTIIQHNTLDGRDTPSGQTLNSGVNFTNSDGTVTTMQVINNRFLDFGNHAINNDSAQGTGALTWSATNNGFWNSTTPNRENTNGLETLSPNSGNFVMAAVDAATGSPINGTGQLNVG